MASLLHPVPASAADASQLGTHTAGSARGAPLGVIKNLILSNKHCSGAWQPSSVWADEDPQGSFL